MQRTCWNLKLLALLVNNLHELSFDSEGQLDDENLGITSLQKMILKFPFQDSLLKDLRILQPEKTSLYSVATVLALANRFPQLGLADAESLDQLREEFLDFQLSPADLPSLSMYKTAGHTEKPQVGVFWSDDTVPA